MDGVSISIKAVVGGSNGVGDGLTAAMKGRLIAVR